MRLPKRIAIGSREELQRVQPINRRFVPDAEVVTQLHDVVRLKFGIGGRRRIPHRVHVRPVHDDGGVLARPLAERGQKVQYALRWHQERRRKAVGALLTQIVLMASVRHPRALRRIEEYVRVFVSKSEPPPRQIAAAAIDHDEGPELGKIQGEAFDVGGKLERGGEHALALEKIHQIGRGIGSQAEAPALLVRELLPALERVPGTLGVGRLAGAGFAVEHRNPQQTLQTAERVPHFLAEVQHLALGLRGQLRCADAPQRQQQRLRRVKVLREEVVQPAAVEAGQGVKFRAGDVPLAGFEEGNCGAGQADRFRDLFLGQADGVGAGRTRRVSSQDSPDFLRSTLSGAGSSVASSPCTLEATGTRVLADAAIGGPFSEGRGVPFEDAISLYGGAVSISTQLAMPACVCTMIGMKVTTERIDVLRAPYSWLKPIVGSWFRVMDRYCEQVDWMHSKSFRKKKEQGYWNGVDCPWWYTERANIGLLAAAATRKGLVTLEEFNDDKVWQRAGYAGRVDLMIWRGPRIKAAAFEAKQAWAHIEQSRGDVEWSITRGSWNRIEKHWAAANRAAKSVHPDYQRYALLFVPIVMKEPGIHGERLGVALESVAKELRKLDRKPGLIAFYTAKRAGGQHAAWSGQGRKSGQRHHVGVALVMARI
jgi:hypothetical protein